MSITYEIFPNNVEKDPIGFADFPSMIKYAENLKAQNEAADDEFGEAELYAYGDDGSHRKIGALYFDEDGQWKLVARPG